MPRWFAPLLLILLAAPPLLLLRAGDDADDRPRGIAARADDAPWPQWRGRNRDGHSDEVNLLREWPEEGPPLVWKADGLGGGMSSVAVAGGRIYTQGTHRGATHLIALDEKDGSLLWTTPIGSGGNPNCTPTVDGERVFGLSKSGDLLCADARTGEPVWRKSFPNDFGGKMMSGWGYSESPLVDGDRLICTPGAPDAMVAALDKQTGRVIWASDMRKRVGNAGQDGAGYSSIVISHGAGIKQYVQLVGRGLISVDAADGRMLWTYNRIANGTANIPTPIVEGDYVFGSTGYGGGGSALLRLHREGESVRVEEVYYRRSRELQNHHGGMLLVGDHLYMGHGHNRGFPVCVELSTGREAWRPGRGPGGGSAAVAYADGHLYFRYEDGVMALIEATPQRFNLKGTFKIATHNGRSWPHPVIAGGRLYLRDQKNLLCYDIRR